MLQMERNETVRRSKRKRRLFVRVVLLAFATPVSSKFFVGSQCTMSFWRCYILDATVVHSFPQGTQSIEKFADKDLFRVNCRVNCRVSRDVSAVAEDGRWNSVSAVIGEFLLSQILCKNRGADFLYGTDIHGLWYPLYSSIDDAVQGDVRWTHPMKQENRWNWSCLYTIFFFFSLYTLYPNLLPVALDNPENQHIIGISCANSNSLRDDQSGNISWTYAH